MRWNRPPPRSVMGLLLGRGAACLNACARLLCVETPGLFSPPIFGRWKGTFACYRRAADSKFVRSTPISLLLGIRRLLVLMPSLLRPERLLQR